MRVTSRNVKSLRSRLGLTASAFARLLGVTTKWVYLYENKAGALKMRAGTLAAFLAAKAMTAKEARAKLGVGKK
jgi:DNA-binding transcriptional regulator YiaG